MSNPAVRRSRPYAFIFQLGKDARVGKKKVPAALASSLCFFYRSEHEPLAAKLDAIAEVAVSEADADLMFTAVDGTIAENELREELYSDAELAAGGPHTEKSGFHAGGTFEACREALVRGGFFVEHLLDPHGLEEVDLSRSQEMDEVLRGLDRHLDLASLPLLLDAVSRRGELPWHSGSVADLLVDTIEGGEAPTLVKRILTASVRWPTELRDVLLVVAAHVARESQGDTSSELAALVSALPPPTDHAVVKLLTDWNVRTGTGAPSPIAVGASSARSAGARPAGARPAGKGPSRPDPHGKGRSRR